ncbi:MAG: dTDP-4-amino-4,6-dideoxygalactose transaminase [Anaerolineaceae bacterium]|nr:dTDP-4-amino-4,6-dideoxygalactose transaminase [Anaerolineaceae bacterium]
MNTENANFISFNKPYIAKNEFDYISQAVHSYHISGDGPFTKKCHQLLEQTFNIKKALLTTNCTHALEMSALLLNLGPGDEVIVPSFTFVSTVNAFILRGAKPVFAEIRPDTLNIDEAKIESLINDHTKAIYVMHYAGVGCEMDRILEIASQYHLSVVEDNAHGLFGKYKGKFLGTFGSMATQSFHETKNISCGEGGALLVSDSALVERAEIIREKGTNRSRFFRGQVDKYTWVDLGSSYLPSDILAAVLLSQLEEADVIQHLRSQIWQHYEEGLAGWAKANSAQLPFIPEHCKQSFHMFYMLLPDLKTRQDLIAYLKDININAVFHYVPLHTSDMGKGYGYRNGDLPVTESVSDRLVRLPFYNDLELKNQEEVIKAINLYHV